MTYTVTLDGSRSWTVFASDKTDAIKKAVKASDFVDAWEWTEGNVVVTPFYGMFYDYDTNTVYDNGAVAIADWTRLGTFASRDVVRPSTKKVRGLNGFLYEVTFYHDGTFMCVDRI
jgi:hypothetical protein